MIKIDQDTLAKAHKLWSVRIAGVIAALAVAEQVWPTVAALLPPGWAAYGAAALAVARVLKQTLVPKDPNAENLQ
jgi:hypothetical protein